MKLIHLSDLHLGRRLNEFNLLEDQRYILTKIINVIDDERPDAVIIAGDIYDKSVPSAEAVELFDDFLVRLAGRKLPVFAISGNHDSPERIAFASRLIDRSGVHLSPVYDGQVTPIDLEDAHGKVHFYMLPFVKPAHVRRYFPDAEITSYTDALRTAVEAMGMDRSERNVLVTHQFVTGAARSESEEISVGGADNVDASVFDGIDYVALGHIHGPQNIGTGRIRYCGTPLKYSFSEAKQEKSVTVVELGAKQRDGDNGGSADIIVRTVPLVPKREMREIRGTYLELTDRRNYDGTDTGAYLHITLTDENDIPDAVQRLRVIYPNLMKLDYDNTRTRSGAGVSGGPARAAAVSPAELFAGFFEKQNGLPMDGEQAAFVQELIEKIWEDER